MRGRQTIDYTQIDQNYFNNRHIEMDIKLPAPGKEIRPQKLANVSQQSFTVSPIPLSGSASSPRSAMSVPTFVTPWKWNTLHLRRSLWVLNLPTDALPPPETSSAPVFDAALVHLLPLHCMRRRESLPYVPGFDAYLAQLRIAS